MPDSNPDTGNEKPVNPNIEGGMCEVSFFALTVTLERQLKTIASARTTLGATFAAVSQGARTQKAIDYCAEYMELTVPKGEKSIVTLQRVIEEADRIGLDTARIKKLMPDVLEINRQVEASRAGPYKTIQIARRQLKK